MSATQTKEMWQNVETLGLALTPGMLLSNGQRVDGKWLADHPDPTFEATFVSDSCQIFVEFRRVVSQDDQPVFVKRFDGPRGSNSFAR